MAYRGNEESDTKMIRGVPIFSVSTVVMMITG